MSLAPSLAAPSLSPALRVAAPAAAVQAAAPVSAVKPSAPGESFGRAAAEDFSARITGERLSNGDGMVADTSAAVDASASQPFRSRLSAASRENDAPFDVHEPASPSKPEGEKRGVGFPLALAGLSGLAWGGAEFARWGARAFSAAQAEPTIGAAALAVAAIGAMVLTGAFVLSTVVDVAGFVGAMWRGRGVTDGDLRAVLRAEVLEGRLDGNAAALVKAYRPDNRYKDFTFAFASRGLIWVRPELAATPWLLRLVLLHELTHMKAGAPRGPPRGALRGLLSAFVLEARARAAEFKGPSALKRIKVPGLQRALTLTQTSLRLSRPYEVLVLNPDTKELEDPKLYAGLSDGAARVTVLNSGEPQRALAQSPNRYRAIVLGRATRVLPEPKSRENLRLQSALKLGSGIASQRLKGLGVSSLMEGLYSGLRDRGLAFLPFGPDDPGVVSWEKLLRHWESADGGQFRVTRVDLEDGGHLLILRKVEARVGLWLRPLSGGYIAASVPNASFSEEGRATARKSLEDAGLGRQLELFEKMEVTVRHVFGADVGRQEIYVTVPRRNASAIRKYVSASAEVLDSQSNFEPHLMDSAELQGVKPVWRLGITGAAGSILWIDTGADSTHRDFGGRLDVVDMVDEGTEDWIGHGTHVAGISISGNGGFLGMAKGAKGTMAKVFSRDQITASDGDIMGSAVIAQRKGVDVISLSFGIRGSSADNLADFFSRLTRQKNAAGEYPIVTASAGNSGPFDRTLSQPAAGVEVIAVAAAAKSMDDGIPEIAFYSSVGPDIDRRYAIKRFRFKPDITAIGGDVTTEPGSTNVYKDGVYSAKSKDSPRSASDLDDGKHTGMSGTSMSNPSLAGIALLVKLAMRSAGAITPFVAENMAFAVKAVLMRSARDMGVPLWFQGAGIVDAWAAVSLVAGAGTRALGAGARGLWRRVTGASPAAAPDAWGWLVRLKAVQDAEDRAFREAELAKSEVQAMGNTMQAEVQKRFNKARDAELPALLEALKDPVWLVRMRAAFVLMNLKSPASAAALAETGLNDPDARVRQMAFLALAEIPTHSVDALLGKAASNESWDVGVYAAYALARHGDRSALARVVKELGSPDKRARFSSAWLLGQTGASAADTSTAAEGLSARVSDRVERGNIRHLASAALSNLADAAPETLSDRVVTDLLDASGPENLALTRTIAKVFSAAVRSKAFVARLRSEPLKPIVMDFVVKNRDAVGKPGALNELVSLLARAAGVPLDAPTPPMDPSGSGVSGVDEAMGPVDVFAAPPPGESSIDAATLARFETTLRESLSVSRGLWLSVPEHKLYALTIALEHRGWSVRRLGGGEGADLPLPAPEAPRLGLMRRVIRGVLGLALAASPSPAPADGGSGWWKDASATRTAVTVPLYALRSQKKYDAGVGKYSHLGRYYRDELSGQGVDAVLLLPHFATRGESPYAPVSLFALNEDQVDWSAVDEVRADPILAGKVVAPSQSVDYPALRAREGGVARAAYARFAKAAASPRARDFADFAARNAPWLDEYAEFMALSSLIGKPALDWTAQDQRAARADPGFAELVSIRRWSQWLAHGQLKAALAEVHAAGGKVLFDIPMFRAKDGVDAWKRPELFADLRTRNPGIINAWVHEDWKDLALWRWSELRKNGYAAALDPYRYWLGFGFDGARADALHFAYKFGNGQLASGDEPGDEFVAALSGVLGARGAFPLAEAFEGKDADVRRLGFVTVGGDWKKVSSHDDARSPDFLGRYFAARREPYSRENAKFVAYTLGDEWLDPFPVKEMRGGVSTWRYRIPLPEDADYANRARSDARPQLRALKATRDGDVWKAPEAVRAAFGAAAGAFVKRDGGSVRIWAASMDWFLEERGRDALISLPGLLLSTGRYDDAKSVLRRFAGLEKGGLIPNRIGDGTNPEYNAADAPMWYVQAVKSYAEATGDWALVSEVAAALRRIMAGYEQGASYERHGRENRIYMDADGLISTPAQATWMDADPEGRDQPVTPRNGKTVEINALWYSNLRFLAGVERRLGDEAAGASRDALADKVKASFNEKFWFATEDNRRAWGGTGGALRDVVSGDPHGDAIRPNMLFAVSRGGDLLTAERRRAVVLAAARDLLTRKGPRTLSDRDSGYRARYDTSLPPLEKDQAYHQGTVWPWLMGAFAEALAQVRRDMGWDEARTDAETRALITPLVEALTGVPEGSLPEVYDGGASDPALKNFSLDDPAGLAPIFKSAGPAQNPGGTRSQAWSVAEILRLLARKF